MAHTEHESHHILPVKLLLKVFGALVVLTILTALIAQIDLGMMNEPIALGIAGVKGALVVLFFMALKYDKGVNSMVFTVGGVFVLVFLFFTLLDVIFRGDLSNVESQTISSEQRRAERLRAGEPADSLLRVTPADYQNAAPASQAAGSNASSNETSSQGQDAATTEE